MRGCAAAGSGGHRLPHTVSEAAPATLTKLANRILSSISRPHFSQILAVEDDHAVTHQSPWPGIGGMTYVLEFQGIVTLPTTRGRRCRPTPSSRRDRAAPTSGCCASG